MKASIVIPSYNSKERLRLNLLALNCQDYEGDDVEIIVVDNGSSDNTIEMLKNIKMKYTYKYIRIEENVGIANGRNKGILEACGDLLIFHDSDMISEKGFITKHIKAHTHKNMVVCGMCWKRIYSYFYKNFSDDQIKDFEKRTGKKAKFTDKFQLIQDKQIKDQQFKDICFDLEIGFVKSLKQIINSENNMLSEYYLPWRFFITNNLSVDRQKVIEVGMLDDNIVKYGYEDYDLGIRLYKSGCDFVFEPDIFSAHQEHTQNFNYLDLMWNLNYICEKYNNIYFIDMILVCLGDCLGIDEKYINLITKDIATVLALNKYYYILELFLNLLQIIRKMYFTPGFDNAIEMFPIIAKDMPKIINDAYDLANIYNVNNLINEVCVLLKKIFDIDLKKFIEI